MMHLFAADSEATWSVPGLPGESLSSVCHWNSMYGTGIGAAGLARSKTSSTAGTFMPVALFHRWLKNEVRVRDHVSYYFFTKCQF